ncbi:MAG: hypothetical protein PHI97_15510 [Desulfobulbus sp.]|nr:hypothetical protein [Desulfobulbus sp.]
MQSLNLSLDPIWLLANESGDTIRLSLPDILLSDTPLFHVPSFGFLSSIQHELLASILQVAVDSIWSKGISKKDYSRLICTEQSGELGTLIQRICDVLEKLKGFALVGNGAFLQIPSAWGRFERKENIARLMWPFIPNIHGVEAKGLRRMSPIPMKLGPDLTALFLFASCTLSKGGTQYWTIGNLTGRALAHYHYGKTMRQRLFSAVLPGYSQYWEPSLPLPWIPDCQNNGGLEHDDRPPFWPYLSGIKKISGTANIRLFQSRAIVLDPPELDKCEISGETTLVFKTFRILSEIALYRKVRELAPANCKAQVPGIMGKMYTKTDHPSVLTQRSEDEENSNMASASLPYHGFSMPSWSIISLAHRCPSHVIQSLNLIIDLNKSAGQSELVLFSLKYAAKNQDVRGAFQYHCGSTGLFNEHKLDLILFLAEKSEEYIKNIRDRIRYLLIGDTNKKNVQRHQKAFETSSIINIYQDIWNTADSIFHEYKMINNLPESWKDNLIYRFEKKIRSCWFQFIEDVWNNGSLSFQDRFQEFTATRKLLGDGFMTINLPFLASNQSVKAGQAFAECYYLLGEQEKSQLINNKNPYTSRYFWLCMNMARKECHKLYQPLYEHALHLLQFIIPVTDYANFGSVLSKHNSCINIERVEFLFNEYEQNGLIEYLQQILGIIRTKKRSLIHLDFGLLLFDLEEFNFRPNMVMRRWATGYFAEKNHAETDNVHA